MCILLSAGCRFTEINAPLTTFQDVEEPNIRHCCFAIRMYDAISKTRVLPQHECIPSDIVIDCHGDCPCFSGVPNSPTPSPPATPPPDITRIIRSHPRSPNSNVRVFTYSVTNNSLLRFHRMMKIPHHEHASGYTDPAGNSPIPPFHHFPYHRLPTRTSIQ